MHSPLFDHPRFQKLSDSTVHRIASANVMRIQLNMLVPTVVPRLSLYANVQWFPNASRASNPYTEYTAHEWGNSVRANSPTVSLGAWGDLVTRKEAQNYFTVSAYVGDLYSPAQRPADLRAYTHKLDVGLVAGVGVFAWLPATTWLHNVTVDGALDYIATGLPRAGDITPAGEREFLEDAHHTSLIVWLSFPIAPLMPRP